MRSSSVAIHDESAHEIPVTPDAETWASMSPVQRDRHIEAISAALDNAKDQMGQGRPHASSKMSVLSVLGDFFQRLGRRVYLGSELAVLFPGEPAFEPDVIAVRDMEDPGEADTRTAWVVSEEGRAPDLALEILYKGSRQKDLVTNVARYARLGIQEYFVYDRLHQRLYGYRLGIGARQYQSISSRSSRLWSGVLELELGIVEGRLRFFYGEAAVPDSKELIGRLDAMLDQRERRIEEEAAARQEAERQVEVEREARRLAEARADDESRARAELEARIVELTARLAERG